MKHYHFSIVIEKDKDGYYAFCPELQGCYTQADGYEQALENMHDAIRLHVEDRLEAGDEIPQPEQVRFVGWVKERSDGPNVGCTD